MDVFSCLITYILGLGLLSYGMIKLIVKFDISKEGVEIEPIKDMLDVIQSGSPGVKLAMIFLLGGAIITEIAVVLINLPAEFLTKKEN